MASSVEELDVFGAEDNETLVPLAVDLKLIHQDVTKANQDANEMVRLQDNVPEIGHNVWQMVGNVSGRHVSFQGDIFFFV